MKKNKPFGELFYRSLKKTLLTMRIAVILMILGILQARANDAFSQKTKFSLNFSDVTLVNVLDKIEDESDFFFLYNEKLLDTERKVSITEKDQLIGSILDDLFRGTDVKYTIVERKIILAPDYLTEAPQPQQKQITGTITGKDGAYLPGVNVVVTGTVQGTITDIAGKYSIEIPQGGKSLTFSFVGMVSQEIAIGTLTQINVTMGEVALGLDEVFGIGYGTTSKRQTVSAISTIQPDKLKNIPVATIGDGLAGRTSGIIVQASGGGPGKQPVISIRGGGTPLVVIDGIVASMADFQFLNPADIESLSILKDAESAAIYGARGGNGIIAVTTNRGVPGKMSITYAYSMDLSQPTILPTRLGSYNVALLANEARANDGQLPAFSAEAVQKFKDQSEPYSYPNIDWQKLTLNTFAPSTRQNLTINGGNEQTKYFASVSYYDQGTLYKFNTNWEKRYNYRFSLTNNFKKIGLTANINVYGAFEKTRFPESQYGTGQATIWHSLQTAFSYEPAYTDLDLYSVNPDNCLVEIDPKSGYDLQESQNVNGILDLAWEVPGVKGLKIKAINQYRLDDGWRKEWNATADQYSMGSTVPVIHNAPRLASSASNGFSYTNQIYGNYTRIFLKDHSVAATFGYEQSYGYGESINATRVGYQLPIDQFIAGPTLNSTNGGSTSENGRAGFFGRLQYTYNNRYFIEGSFRHDGSDWFPKDKRWGTFGSGSAGWIVSNEAFLKTLNDKNIINFLKIRGSIGTVGLDGGDAGISRFQYIPGYNIVERGYVINNSFVQGFTEGPLVSPDLTWYSQTSRNIGFDFASLNSKLSGSFDYFYLTTTGMLASLSGTLYTDPVGISLPSIKSDGKFRRAGFEISLNYKDNFGDLQYEISGNLTRYDQLWEINPNEDESTLKNPYTRTTNQTGYYGIGYHNLGYYTSPEDVMNNPKLVASTNLVPGDIKYSDTNGDGKIDKADQKRIGKNSFPRLNYGINLDFRYKAWSLFTLIQGSGNQDVYPGDMVRGDYWNSGGIGGIYTFQEDYWRPDNKNAIYPRLMSSQSYNGNNNTTTSDFWLTNARYVRLKSLQLGYDIKQRLLKSVPFISQFSIIMSGSNLVTISDLLKKFKMDPEAGSNNNYDYPTERVYSLKVIIGF